MPHIRRRRSGRRTTVAAVLAVAAVWAGGASGAREQATVNVFFLQGEQMISVTRPGATAQDAIRQLLVGPTRAEVKRGIRTYVPPATPLVSVTVVNGVANVDLGVKFVKGRDAQSLLARLSQVVHTATGPEGATKVRLRIEGGTPLGVFPGVSTAGPITIKYLQTPDIPVWKPPPAESTPVSGSLRVAQQRLADLGFLLQSGVDGQEGPATEAGVLAFQKWEGLDRDADLGPQTLRRLQSATRPRPITRAGAGKRVEVLLDRQVALAIQNNEVVRVLHVSTGAPATPTPPGDFKVYAKHAKWWSVPFREWLLWALPFNGGIAFHEFPEVPANAASHGCVRQSFTTAKWLYGFAEVGMPVKVIASSR